MQYWSKIYGGGNANLTIQISFWYITGNAVENLYGATLRRRGVGGVCS
jgi:hypothetical protein